MNVMSKHVELCESYKGFAKKLLCATGFVAVRLSPPVSCQGIIQSSEFFIPFFLKLEL